LSNFDYFLQSLDNVLQSLYTPAFHIIICGVSINYLVESEKKNQLDNLLLMYYLTGIGDFPTRIIHSSATTIDIFIDIARLEDYLLIPFSNVLSDHDAQILMIKISFQIQSYRLKIVRKVDKYTIMDFIYKLSNEFWIFHGNDGNVMFNSFLNICLRIFYSSFLPIRTKSRNNKNSWLTLGFKTSCKRQREMFLLCRNSNNPELKQYYNTY
jgi:hypothetical protein